MQLVGSEIFTVVDGEIKNGGSNYSGVCFELQLIIFKSLHT